MNCKIINNTSADEGGGIFVYGCSPILSDLEILNNYAPAFGGGLWCGRDDALYFSSSDIVANNLLVSNNESETGAGIYISQSNYEIDVITVNNNSSTQESAGIYIAESNGSISNATISNNISNTPFELFHALGATQIKNCIVYGSNYTEEGPIFSENISDLDISFSNIQGGWEGEGNIDANPLFCNPDSGDYTLAENSPCVGTGEDGANMGAFSVGCGPLILAPVILDIAFDQQIYEDDSLTIVVSATSVINASMTFTATSDTSDVSVTMDSTTLTATPAPDWNGSSLITVIVIDENELSDTTDFTLTVNAVNDAPVANNDTIMVDHNTDYVGQISWSDVDGDMEFSCYLLSSPSNGMVTVALEGSFVYSPTTDYSGSDSFTFTVCDNSLCDTATVLITIHSLSLDETSLPTEFALRQNYPNPFNPITTLRYDLPENALVNITIYNMLGREVKILVNQTQDAGYRSIIWDATNDYGKPVSAGIYLYQIQAGEYMQTKKMVLLK